MITRGRGFCLGSLLLLSAAPAFAKPLYLTVPRTFGTQESPTIELAFAAKEPVELRVLHPNDVDAFLRSQANLRRAYAEPEVVDNPGHYLAHGLNAVRSPGAFLLRALSPALRSTLSKDVGGKDDPPPDGHPSRLGAGPPKLIDPPGGMSLVRSVWLNLDLGGASTDYNVPGFGNGWFWGEQYEQRRVALDPLPAGVYVVQVVQHAIEGQVVLVVSDLKVQVKQTDGEALVRVAGADLKPVAGATVSVYGPSGPLPGGTTDARGELAVATTEPRLLFRVATSSVPGSVSGADTAVVDTDFYTTVAALPDLFLYSDRPLYKPGDTVQFRGILRQPDSFLARLFRPRHREVTVEIVAAQSSAPAGEPSGDKTDGKAIAHTTATVDSFGCIHGTLKVPPDASEGVLRLTAHLDGRAYQSEARVQDYVKPTFYLELSSETETVRPGEPGNPLRAKIRGRRFAGGPAAGAAYEVFLYRTLLDSPAWVDSAGVGGQGSAVTYGPPATNEGQLSVPERLYSSVEEAAKRNPEETDSWASAPKLDANGEADIEIQVPALKPGDERKPYRYSLSVRARDDQGTFANAGRTLFLAPSEVMGTLRAPGLVLSGAEAQLAVRASTLSGKALPGTHGHLIFSLRRADGSERQLAESDLQADDRGVFETKLPTAEVGTVTASVTLIDTKGHPWTGEASTLVAGVGGEATAPVAALTLGQLAPVAEPGEDTEVVALFPEHWGAGGKESGPVWFTLVGQTIYSTELLDFSGRTLIKRFPIERRFGSAVYAQVAYPTAVGRWEERTVPFRIVPRERSLQVEVQPVQAEAPPLGRETVELHVVDSQGRGSRAQVSVGVVDQAVYALQAEFRPRALDFFYPLGRNNVQSFDGADFQGYGYGEVIARGLAKLPGFALATLKPPTHKPDEKERDTAFWSATVLTDRDGLARVTFDLPSNQTKWTVTAVAADADGRFGEGTGEFASRGEVNLAVALPQFLRLGDTAEGSVRVAAGPKLKGDTQLAVEAAVQGAAKADDQKQSALLKSGGELLVPLALDAQTAGDATVAVVASGASQPLALHRQIPVRPTAIHETFDAVAYGGGALAPALPKGAQVQALTLTLLPSTLATALDTVRGLLDYPYGCLEQLVATTIPNIAVARTLEKAGSYAKLDPDSKALLAEARSRAAQGIDRILALAAKDGGFYWFQGDSQPNYVMSLIALDGLSYAVEAGLVPADHPAITKTVEYLSLENIGDGDLLGRRPLPPLIDAFEGYVLARVQGAARAPEVRALLDRMRERSAYEVALAVLAAEAAGIAKEPQVQARVAELTDPAAKSLSGPVAYAFEPELFVLPLREVGLTAIVGHAASLGGKVDVALARRRFLEMLAPEAELSTYERATALLQSLWLLDRDVRELKTAPPPEVSTDHGKVELVPRGGGFAAAVDPGATHVQVGSFEGVARLTADVDTPLASVQPQSQGMSIQRTYYAIRDDKLYPLKPGESVPQGQDVYVELVIDAHGDADAFHSVRSAYYVAEDPIPAGFVPLTEDKIYQGAPHYLPLAHPALKRRTLDPERATFYFAEPTWWSDTPHRLGYVVRAQFPGKFSAPPPTIEDMYVHAIRGRGAAATLEVAASGVPSKRAQ